MDIFATITAAAVPVNGLTDPPEIRIRDDANTIVQAFTAMTDLTADGKYLFPFAIPDPARNYTFLVDADPLVSSQVPASDRFYFGGFQGDGDVSAIPAAYQAGIWVDTIGGGAAGTVVGVNGLQTNPVDNITDALAMATALNIRSFKLRGPITLNAAFPFAVWEAVAGGGTLDPGGFDVGGGIFDNVGLTGVVNVTSGAIFGFETSLVGPVSGLVGVFTRPGLAGTITLGAGTSTIAQGASLVPGLSTPVIDLNGVASLNLRAYSGGLDLRGSSAGGQNSSIEIVAGQVILDASNTAGTIAVRGWPNVIDNSAGATINTDGLGSIIVDAELTAQHGAGSWAGIAATLQQIRDAMKLAPTGGAPAAGSVDQYLIDILLDTANMNPIVATNLDALVSSRAAPGDAMTLTAATLLVIQASILSDATPFAGADVTATLAAVNALGQFIEGGRDIDFTGNDALGWQRIERDIGGTLIRRYNLFDETGSRIDETVASFIGRQGMISSEVAI